MANRHISSETKRQAVALARVAGADLAAHEYGVDRRSVLRWMADVGAADPTAPTGTRDQWQALADAAHARVSGMLRAGKVNPVQAATISAIAQRNLNALPPEPVDERTDAERWGDDFEQLVSELRPDLDPVRVLRCALHDADLHLPDPVAVARWLRALDPDAHDAAYAAVEAAQRAETEALIEVQRALHTDPARSLPPDVRELLARADAYLEETTP